MAELESIHVKVPPYLPHGLEVKGMLTKRIKKRLRENKGMKKEKRNTFI
jgi:hypothetical protein